MLDLVGQVWERDWKRSTPLQDAQDDMWGSIADLASAARDVLKPLRSEDDDVLIPSEGKSLVEAATACVRAAGECVAESRFVIDRIGDFEFEGSGLGISEIEKATLAAGDTVDVWEGSQSSMNTDAFPIPPEPSSEAPPPPPHRSDLSSKSTMTAIAPLSESSSGTAVVNDARAATFDPMAHKTLPQIPATADVSLFHGNVCSSLPTSTDSTGEHHGNSSGHVRAHSLDASSAGDGSTYVESVHGSDTSSGSTRGTSPDATLINNSATTSFSSDGQSTIYDDLDDSEAKIMETTFAHELVYNKEGQITGGTLPALIERLTTHDSTPDATFVSTFYLTFRLFATPTAFAQALIDRFQYVAESPRIAGPVRLRVYNVFKGWLESHWRNDCDSAALDLIVPFANRQLQIVLPTAGKRLATLAAKVTAASGPLVPRLISSMGKTNTSIGVYIAPDTPLPPPIITKSQLGALKNWKHGGASISILDFDPLELARQFTIKESQIFCSILPEELLATEWMKKSGSMAVNVRAMSRLSTDLTNLVADCILQLECPKKRAVIIKQWVKIANRLLDLANYDSLMAIICALDGSTIARMKRTWELVSTKTKATLEHLKSVVDISRNYTVLRQRLQNHVPPCLPFVGTYLTDLTFVDVGNQTTRQLHGDGIETSKAVINYDKHMKTAKIISELQRFQIPYRFTEIPELQTWMQDQLVRVRTSDECNMTNHYRRSLLLEPRDQMQQKPLPVESQPSATSKDKFDLFSKGWAYHSKEKLAITPM
ncbi:son of sevenless, partial [Lecanoromycetidae sp. Uapishka_2]